MKAEKVDFTGGSIRAVGATSTYNKDLAQKLDVTTSLFSNMCLVIYKSGGGTNEDNPAKAYLNGAIVEDCW